MKRLSRSNLAPSPAWKPQSVSKPRAAAKLEAETLTARMIEPRPSIDAAAGKMESDSPLFYGTIHPTLF